MGGEVKPPIPRSQRGQDALSRIKKPPDGQVALGVIIDISVARTRIMREKFGRGEVVKAYRFYALFTEAHIRRLRFRFCRLVLIPLPLTAALLPALRQSITVSYRVSTSPFRIASVHQRFASRQSITVSYRVSPSPFRTG